MHSNLKVTVKKLSFKSKGKQESIIRGMEFTKEESRKLVELVAKIQLEI